VPEQNRNIAAGGNGAVILFHDEHLLAVNKPSGINTHKPDRFAPDGLHEWLSRRHGALSVLHRLDKETSGVIVFGRTRAANQSLSRQFESRQVRKEYLLFASRRPSRQKFTARSADAETEFEFVQPHGNRFLIRARPLTGKTHQIRRHAADNGFPILGDIQYGGEPASRLMLHAHRITFTHLGEAMTLEASVPAAFEDDDALTAAREFRNLIFDEDTNAFRLLSGAADGFPDVIVDSYDGRLLVQWQTEPVDASLYDRLGSEIYEQVCTKQKRTTTRYVRGEAPARFPVRENGLRFLVGFGEGLSTGLFMDQRENRWRLLQMDLHGKSVLNTFAYTCAFSVAVAKVGAVTTSVDLSRNYLDWGKENFRANNLRVDGHEFLSGDVFDWFKRFAKRGRQWDMVILDPPTFSTTKDGRRFQAERDYSALAAQAAALVSRGGTLFCSTNQRTLSSERFEAAVRRCGREVSEVEFATVPWDFREAPYLKTLWARLD
jgi:23S rRNA (cytosine1962-C5)-methyltransferase